MSLEPLVIPATTYPMSLGNGSVEFDMQAFDEAIKSKGVLMTHYRALRSPVSMTDINDIRRPNEDHVANTSGWLYRMAGQAWALTTGNSKRDKLADVGDIEGSTVRATFPRTYVDGSPMRVAVFDRFYMADTKDMVLVPHWQLFTADETGTDKLTYPVAEVEIIVDADGREYGPSTYSIDAKGQIVWGAQRPTPGAVCSARYLFVPYWYVHSIEHEVRLAAQTSGSERRIMRQPQAVLLQRERVFENQKRDELSDTPGSLRQVRGPADGSFGPR